VAARPQTKTLQTVSALGTERLHLSAWGAGAAQCSNVLYRPGIVAITILPAMTASMNRFGL
jgi:hypothetical protein